MRRILLLTCVVFLLGWFVAPAHAASEASTDDQVTDAEQAIDLAREDPATVTQLALRPGLTPSAKLADFDSMQGRFLGVQGRQWVVFWDDDDGKTRMSTTVNAATGRVLSQGQSLVVMPDRPVAVVEDLARPWLWIPLLVAFIACLAFAPRRHGPWLLGWIAASSVLGIVTVLNAVPAEHVRWGNVALFAAAALALVGLAVHLVRLVKGDASSTSARLPVIAAFVIIVGAFGLQVAAATSMTAVSDVAWASSIGAELMRDGVPVYGNVLDIPGVVVYADTYGPTSYLAYVPSTWAFEKPLERAIWTNLALSLITCALVFLIGRRRDLRTAAWAAAAWASCPVVAFGVVAGNNDVVVATALILTVVVLGNPLLRGTLLAVTAATKFLPVLLLPIIVRLRGEDRRAGIVVVSSFVGVGLLLAMIGLRGTEALQPFWDRAVVYQLDRDDIASFWGLTGLGRVRMVFMFAAIGVAGWSAWVMRRRDARHAPALMAATLALLLVSLPQYWSSYVTWIVPLVIAALAMPDASPVELPVESRESTEPTDTLVAAE